jgi:SAM-dependent methyltransferase
VSDPAAVRAEWSDGDYPSIGVRLRPAAEALIGRLAPLDGAEVLDVATGTGNAALLAARAGASVVGVDLTPELLDIARRRARDEGLYVDFIEGDAEALEFEEDRFDVVVSTFGVIFAPRPAVAAGELARVLTPGGRLGLTTWPIEGLAAAMRGVIARHLPNADPPPPEPPPWVTAQGLRELFAPRGVHIEVERRDDVVWRFDDAAEAVTFVETSLAGEMRTARLAVDAAGGMPALRADLQALFTEWDTAGGDGLALPFDYLLVTGTKTG